ncbi:hypothetical protein L0Z31_27045 [Burkholderia vietnamiensis]|uniref:hypothetical protein n=1 Tax=Burkholderia vietnamiensis TaxID=60552 RepID=UPI0020189744|nr:hypothetical protein [Burkholderia vietnamiensis]MCO1351223.1 hypothetical protein [Burkholderia vietnamiensis]MCO1433574.1 hypothetical protein [Burkholderia vietnamiensis]UQN48232.1 hypothetical protein L0Y95_17285 [Burkholderia vietnamiensis]HDR9021950.1 hypothetical protein [Burkholderia vietnamiensis]HDR9260131.1 hypothetical protein [Burkholderia vietnamiensis]
MLPQLTEDNASLMFIPALLRVTSGVVRMDIDGAPAATAYSAETGAERVLGVVIAFT